MTIRESGFIKSACYTQHMSVIWSLTLSCYVSFLKAEWIMWLLCYQSLQRRIPILIVMHFLSSSSGMTSQSVSCHNSPCPISGVLLICPSLGSWRQQGLMRRFMYCKVVLTTSLVWVLVDVFLLLYFSECNKCDNKKDHSLLPALRGESDRLTES